jgi:hypothetical protein
MGQGKREKKGTIVDQRNAIFPIWLKKYLRKRNSPESGEPLLQQYSQLFAIFQ